MRQAAIMWLALLCGCLAARAESSPRIVLAVDRILEIRNLPALVADRMGYFRDAGLNVAVLDMREDVSADDMIADGRIDGGIAFYHHTIMAQAAGKKLVAVVLLGVSPAETLMVSNRLSGAVRSVADLKGRKIITGGANSGKTTGANWLALHAGLGLDQIIRLPLAERADMVRQLESGEADAIVAHEPDASEYQAGKIAFPLVDLTVVETVKANLGTIFPTTSLYLSQDFIDAHPETVRHLVGALIKALNYIHAHDANEIAAALPKQALGKSPDVYRRSLAHDVAMFATDGGFPPEAVEALWKTMAALTPAYAKVKPGETFTNRFVEH